MKQVMTATLVVALGVTAAAQEKAPKDTIEVVFCIDCSGSMGGVIETAKQKVWAIVNQIAKDRPKAAIRIGLIGYGNADRDYRFFPLSDDLDEVYKNLMTFKDEGWGDEYVGLVIHKATNEMKWTEAANVLKIIFVVGNETARQGPEKYDYTKTARAAIRKEIIVNAIYCGKTDDADARSTWKEFAKLADGSYQEIGAQGGAVSIASPFDKELAELSAKLNGTYIAYGKEGERKKREQEAQDENARRAGSADPAECPAPAAADRALAKCAGAYDNRKWDLVDASKDKDFDIAKVSEADLPEEMRRMSVEERRAYVEGKKKEREEIQAKIRELSEKREAYIKDEMAKQGLSESEAFDAAVRQTICEQAKRKGDAFGR